MALHSGVVLPFFLLASGIVLAFVDLLGTARSRSAMTPREVESTEASERSAA